MTAAPILNERIDVRLGNGCTTQRPACVFGPLAVTLQRVGDTTHWIVVHVPSGAEITAAASPSGTEAMVMVGALLALDVDWYRYAPIVTDQHRDQVVATIARVRGRL